MYIHYYIYIYTHTSEPAQSRRSKARFGTVGVSPSSPRRSSSRGAHDCPILMRYFTTIQPWKFQGSDVLIFLMVLGPSGLESKNPCLELYSSSKWVMLGLCRVRGWM